jgi:hypothetical protein
LSLPNISRGAILARLAAGAEGVRGFPCAAGEARAPRALLAANGM